MAEQTRELGRRAGALLPFPAHELRDVAVGEVHARPFRPIATPRVLHHLAFINDEGAADYHAVVARFCASHGVPAPPEGARHHVVSLGDAELAWERHTEFTSLTLAVTPPPRDPFAAPNPSSLAAFLPKPPGPLLVACRLAIVADEQQATESQAFDPASRCLAEIDGGAARVETDFRPDPSGFTRILVLNRKLTADQAGALCQRLLEIETYRTLALLGLPEAHRLTPIIERIETSLLTVTRQMRESAALDTSRELLQSLVALAAVIESEAVAAAYRFGATAAYAEVVNLRLESIRETPVAGFGTLEGFLSRRMKPALHTCRTVENRLGALSAKIARTADLLRTRVDIELESQNRNLLASMNRRARLQLRLQQTVEGLSVAAISYYVVGLLGYLLRGGESALGIRLDPTLALAVAVPLVVVLVWLIVRRVRRHHSDVEPTG